MLIQCTKKLLDQLKIKPEALIEEDPLFSWHANLLTLNRRKAVAFVNDKTRYIIVLYGLKAKDFIKLDEIFLQTIRETFREESIKENVIEQFINSSKGVAYSKTKNRTSVARMNNSIESMEFYSELLTNKSIYQTKLSMKSSRYLVGIGGDNYIIPCEEMYKEFQKFTEGSIFSCKAVEIKVTLQLKNYNVWRRLIVLLNITFKEFHDILQKAFGWKNYHLHDFYIFENNSHNPVLHIVDNEESLFYSDRNIKTQLEGDMKISEYIPKYRKIKYGYDFGDDWQHHIEVERVYDDYPQNYAMCIAGHGTTPPEDVGGESGYEEFLKIINDKNNAEYNNTLSWAKMQRYKKFNIDDINREIKSLFMH